MILPNSAEIVHNHIIINWIDFDSLAPNPIQTTILDFTLWYSYTHTLKHAQTHMKFNLHYFILRQTDWKLKSQSLISQRTQLSKQEYSNPLTNLLLKTARYLNASKQQGW